MAIKPSHATTRSARYALGPGADLPVARVVAVLLVLLPIAAWLFISNQMRAPATPTPAAQSISNFNPRSLFADQTPHFLPTPVAALPAESNAGPPAPAASEQTAAASSAPIERVKVANTGGAGAILRADPPKGRQVLALRDGTLLQVVERQQLEDGTEWLHVKTADNVEGWIFSRLVAAA